MEFCLAVLVIILALGFDFTNGFHDAANAIAISISTRALTPRIALAISVIMNLVGALLGTEVASTIAESIVNLDSLSIKYQLLVILAALTSAIFWNFFTWFFGIPSSSSHAIIGALAGSGVAAYTITPEVQVYWNSVLDKVIIPMFASPVIGFVLAYVIMLIVLQICKNFNAGKVIRRFRFAQIFSSSAIALGHGLQDAQKSMGIIFLAAISIGWANSGQSIPFWVKLSSAVAIALGTSTGGFRVMKTIGKRIFAVDSPRGFVAEFVGASVLYSTAFIFHAPISTTQTITSAVMGVGATKRLSAVKWDVIKDIVITWFLTLPSTAIIGLLVFFPLKLLVDLVV